MMPVEFVSHPWINSGTIEKRPYQENIAKTAMKGNTLCVLPTGLGKTSVAAMVTAERLLQDHGKKILFMAPTRPLVSQHKKNFERFLKSELRLSAVTGLNKPEERACLYRNSDIIFSTPQCVGNDLKNGRLSLQDFSLCIFDEAHRCTGNYAYAYVAKKYISQSAMPLILALTASPGSHMDRIKEIRQKLFISHVEVRNREDADVKPYVQPLKIEWVEVELPVPIRTLKGYFESIKNDRIKKLMGWRIINTSYVTKAKLLELQQQLAKKGTGMAYAAMSILSEVIKADHALMLLETQCIHSLKRYLDKVSAESSKAAMRLKNDRNFMDAARLAAELYGEGREHPKIGKLKEIVGEELRKDRFAKIIVFAQFRDTIEKINETLKGMPGAAPAEFIGQAKRKGKGMSQKEQAQILNEFEMGFYNILIATQIGEEGLDMAETSTVIFYEPVPSAIRLVQRTGRTARTQPGKVIMLITKKTRDEAYHWAARSREKKMSQLLHMQKKGQMGMEDFSTEQSR